MHAMLTDLVMKSTVVLAVGCVAGFTLRRAPAAMRHLLWAMVALALLLVPALELVMPAWHVRALRVPAAFSSAFTFSTQATGSAQSGSAAVSQALVPGAPSGVAAKGTPALPLDWVLLIWAAGVAVSLARLLAGIVVCGVFRRNAQLSGVIDGVAVLRGPRSTMPITFGIFRPAILLPRDAESWNDERRHIVIAHELAHVRRRDCLVQMMARLAFSFYWFHPLAWWASRQLVREREHASDDLVLATGVRASDYAAVLLDVAKSFQPAGVVAAAAGVAMARRSELEGRMLAILDSNLRRGVVSRAGAVAASACALALVLPLAAMRPAPQTADTAPAVLTDDLLNSTDYIKLRTMAKAELDAHLNENAQKLAERSLEVRLQKFGEQSPEFATGLIDLAAVYRATKGQWEKAIGLYQRALPIQEATLGPDHPDVATTLYYLARYAAGNPHLVPDAAKRYAEAQPMYQRALDIRTKAFGPSDPRVAEVLIAMAQLNDDEALYQRALSVVDTGGHATSQTATALELYAHYLEKNNRGGEAAPLLVRAKEIRTARVEQIGARRGPLPGPSSKAARLVSGMTPPKLKYKIEPEYSEEARGAKLQGTVVLRVDVGADGLAHNIQLLRGIGSGLDEKAAEAVSRWTFTPATKDGQPVDVMATIEVNFKLL